MTQASANMDLTKSKHDTYHLMRMRDITHLPIQMLKTRMQMFHLIKKKNKKGKQTGKPLVIFA